METNPTIFTKLIETTEFSPSKEQFIKCAKNFRTNFQNACNLFDVSEFSTSLTPYLYHLSSCYTPELLLRTYAIDNNDFLSDLIKFSNENTMTIDNEIINKVKNDYINNEINESNLEEDSSEMQ